MSTEHEATEPTADATPDAPLDRGVVIGEGLTTLARWSWRLLLVAGASVVLWWLLAKLWVGVFPVLLALIVATGYISTVTSGRNDTASAASVAA